jgi:hypothetical protein
VTDRLMDRRTGQKQYVAPKVGGNINSDVSCYLIVLLKIFVDKYFAICAYGS